MGGLGGSQTWKGVWGIEDMGGRDRVGVLSFFLWKDEAGVVSMLRAVLLLASGILTFAVKKKDSNGVSIPCSVSVAFNSLMVAQVMQKVSIVLTLINYVFELMVSETIFLWSDVA